MAKKTVNVERFKNYANQMLASKDSYSTKDFKSGICSMIETVLHETGNYQGFMFLDNKDSEFNTLGYYRRKYF